MTRRRGGAIRARVVAASAAALVVLAALGAAQDKGPAGPPRLPDLPAPILVVPDRHSSTAGLEYSDLAAATFQLDRDEWVVQAEMSRPLVEGMFTVIEMEWDCDGQRSTTELETRAAVGSRFHPSAWTSAMGGTPPMTLVRASWASPFDERRGDPLNAPRVGMTNWAALATPAVGGSRIQFRVPRELPEKRGLLTATSRPAFRLSARTTCSEHPLTFDYAITDAGRAIKVDGDVSDWSGGPYATDGTGELHRAVSHLDLKSVWCEHGPDCVFLRADFAVPGFGRIPASDGDVFVEDALVVNLEPLGAAYMDPVRVSIPATSAAGDITDWPTTSVRGADAQNLRNLAGRGRDVKARYASGNSTVEVWIPRKPEQTRFRVAVWTDAERVDELGDGWRDVPR